MVGKEVTRKKNNVSRESSKIWFSREKEARLARKLDESLEFQQL